MKKLFISLSVVCLLASCTKLLDTLTTFQFKRDATFFMPSSATLGVPISLNSTEVQTSHETEFENNNTSIENVEYIKVVALSLEIITPETGDFNFLKSITLNISADGLPDKVIAEKADLSNDGLSKIDLDVSSEDLKPYLTAEKFKLKIEAVTDKVLTTDYDIKTESTFEAKAKTR
jgi:hypothetical protein